MGEEQSKLVSVIIPTFGRPALLNRAIESVLEQTYDNFEVIVVDDNDEESDFRKETEAIMSKYEENNQITYIKHKYNKNGAAARNTGITNSNGSYLCFLDDDDYFLPNKLDYQLKVFEENVDASAVYCGWIKKKIKYYPKYEGDMTKELLLMDYEPITPTLMFKRESIIKLNGFDENYKRHQDYELMLRFFSEGFKVLYTNKFGVVLGENDGSNQLVGDKLKKLKEYFLNQFEDQIENVDKTSYGFKKKVHVRHYMKVVISYIKCKDYKKAIVTYLYYFSYSPFNTINESIIFLKKYLYKK